LLPIERSSVSSRNIVCRNAYSQDDTAKLAERVEWAEGLDNESTDSVIVESFLPVWVQQQIRAETDAEELDKELASSDSAGCCGEGSPTVSGFRVVYNVISGCGRPAKRSGSD